MISQISKKVAQMLVADQIAHEGFDPFFPLGDLVASRMKEIQLEGRVLVCGHADTMAVYHLGDRWYMED